MNGHLDTAKWLVDVKGATLTDKSNVCIDSVLFARIAERAFPYHAGLVKYYVV